MSFSKEILSFLVPNLSDFIQLSFFLVMFGATAFTIFKVKRSAKPEKWEEKWNGGTFDDLSDDLDAEHGSVSDISNAVSTKWEKLSEAMPGILLILGLLGTFLGLGIALNKASLIIAVGAEDSMGDLMSMMSGLGTKFKTSTWGIIAFLSLKIWISYDGFEENRLRWCIRKVKGELDKKRHEASKRNTSEHQEFLTSIRELGKQLCHTMQVELAGNRDILKENSQLLLDKKNISLETNIELQKLTVTLNHQLEESKALAANSQSTRVALEAFVESNSSNLNLMQKSSTQMANAADKVGESASDLKSAISQFQVGVADVLATLKKDLGETISAMSASFGSNMASMSKELESATTGISTAVNELAVSVGATMTSVETAIEDSLKIQKKAQTEFLVTSETLNTNVGAMTDLVNQLRGDITSGLKAVSESNRSVQSLNTRYKQIAESASTTSDSVSALVGTIKESTNENTQSNQTVTEILERIDDRISEAINKNRISTLVKKE
jgi:hypothetical protein